MDSGLSGVTVEDLFQLLGMNRLVDDVRAAGLQSFVLDVTESRDSNDRNQLVRLLVVDELGDG